ncbi:hypothetical protein EUGRSUZ_E03864 [Eucalyptus grandis]|uniref:Uncharacterized protein n=2 Tax=Eucalyptus grandis TaxID=71139 RepID=A0ACC3L1P8_EUCGR|nr:hypothetical protein EUGRSUZ_E03864 [Eucalyptus grandis]
MFVSHVIMGVVVGSVHVTVTAEAHQYALMDAGGHPTSAYARGHRCAIMGAGGRPTSAVARDLFTRGVAIATAMETPLHHGPCMAVTTEGRQHAPMPVTTATLPARSCEESFEVFVKIRSLFPRLGVFMRSVGSRHGSSSRTIFPLLPQ